MQVSVYEFLGIADFTALAGCGSGGADGTVKALRAVGEEVGGASKGTHYSGGIARRMAMKGMDQMVMAIFSALWDLSENDCGCEDFAVTSMLHE